MNSDFSYEEDFLEDEKVDLRKYYRMLYRRWWLILGLWALVTIPWTVYVKMQPAVYEATALIRFKTYDAENSEALSKSRQTELKSRTFAETVVSQLGLTLSIDPSQRELQRRAVFSLFRSTDHVQPGQYALRLTEDKTWYELYKLQEDRAHQKIAGGSILDVVEKSKTVNGFTFQLTEDYQQLPEEILFNIQGFRSAVNSLRRRTVVVTNKSGTLMSITMTDRDPFLVAQIVNRLAEVYVARSVNVKRDIATNTRNILQDRKDMARKQLDGAEETLKSFKARHFVSLDNEVKSQLAQLSKSEEKVAELQGYKANLNELFGRLEHTNGDAEDSEKYVIQQIAGHDAFASNLNMGILKSQLADLLERRSKLTEAYSANHPEVKSIDQEVEQLYVRIRGEARNQLREMDSQISKLSRDIASLKGRLRNLPTQESRLAELTRDRDLKEEIYLNLESEYQKASISEAVEAEDVEILDPAIESDAPINRDKKMRALMGGLVGLVVGLGAAFILEFLDKTVKTIEDVKRYIRMPVLGTIPDIQFGEMKDFQDMEKTKQIDYQLVTHDYSPTPIGESYRSLRTNLLFSKNAGKLQTLVITSTAPGDGKSFTAANLAITMAQQRSNTLLVDTDLRRGVQHNTFGARKEPGFTNLLMQMSSLSQAINETHIPNLNLLCCGSLTPNPSELLGSPQMTRFLEEIKRKFDFIIFDSPPLNAATDAVVLGTRVDGVVLVVRSGVTDRDLARQKLDLFDNVPARFLGVVLNGTSPDLAHDGYSYYHY